MAKSMRSKREKRLRAIRREMVEPLYEKKDAAKLAAQEAALAAPKLPVRSKPTPSLMETSDPITSENDGLMGTPTFLYTSLPISKKKPTKWQVKILKDLKPLSAKA
ncbi:hypothetical protein LIER_09768 [Lithospermum erythrorhizon]|uniref:Uncharacterized protein n=1 Tax=Lithospermum erythrorhizon TaxID=34254 RepID=A0AAV3PIW7_LITER